MGVANVAAVRRILVVKLADLGDAVLATPAIGALRRAFPTARIDALTTPSARAVLDLCPAVDRTIGFPKALFDRPTDLAHPARLATMARLAAHLRAQHYDAVVLLHHLTTGFGALKFRALARAAGAPVVAGLDNGRGTFLTHRATDLGFGARTEWQYGLDIVATLGVPTDGAGTNLQVPEAARAAADRLLAQAGVPEPFIVVHPGVGPYSQARAWPADRFAAVARDLRATTGMPIVAVGTRDEAAGSAPLLAESGVANLLGRTTIAELAAVLERAALVIGADSGVAHLAAALRRPTLAIFGPSNHDAWRPIGAALHYVGTRPFPDAEALVVRARIPCAPCLYTGYTLGQRQGCALRTCLDWITASEIVEAALHMLRNSGAIDAPGKLP